MKSYSFAVENFLPEKSQSPDVLCLQMTTDRAEAFIKSFSDAVKGAKMCLIGTPPENILVAIVLCGELGVDSINNLLSSDKFQQVEIK